jgi:light-regulated signal transduction histidine kinase (bacteriophytochrome)
VRDNGVGFDTAAAAQLFKPFMRLHGRGAIKGNGGAPIGLRL